MTNLIGGLPAFLSERQVMYRERAASMYAVLPFGIATGVVEAPYLVTQALIFVPISYFMIGFKASAEPLILYIIIFTESIGMYTFMACSPHPVSVALHSIRWVLPPMDFVHARVQGLGT